MGHSIKLHNQIPDILEWLIYGAVNQVASCRMNDATSTHGGAGRGQGRKPLSEDGAKPYKLLLTDAQRIKLNDLGNAAWIREQIDYAIYLKEIDMSKAVNLSARYINALRQLPQFIGTLPPNGPLTHCMTGVRVLPTGDLTDEHDDSGILEVIYPGGGKAEVIGQYFMKMALKEAAEIHVATTPNDFGIKGKSYSDVQKQVEFLGKHLSGKHNLYA